MELKELTEKVTGLLDVQNTEELPEKIFKAVKNDDFNAYEKFCNIVQDEKPCIVSWKIGRKSRSSNRSVRG